MRRSRIVLLGCAFGAAGLIRGSAGLAQEGVTTVEVLVSRPLAAVPEVGEGATYFTPEELNQVAEAAGDEHQEARDGARDCGAVAALTGPSPEDAGEFNIGALMATEARDQYQLQQAALRASEATQAAIAARRAAVMGEGKPGELDATELARQAATRTYQDAQKKAAESHNRLNDLEDKAWSYTNGDVIGLQALDLGRYIPGCQYNAANPSLLAPGVIQPECAENPMENMNLPQADGGLGKTPQRNKVEGMRQFQALVDERTRQRTQNGGQQVVFVPEEFRDLRLSNITAYQREEKGKTVLRVTGKINNTRKNPISVPPLWVSVIDRYGTSLYSKQIEAPRGQPRIKPASSLTFTYAIDPIPAKTVRASVTFAPLHHAPAGLPSSAFCSPRSASLRGATMGLTE